MIAASGVISFGIETPPINNFISVTVYVVTAFVFCSLVPMVNISVMTLAELIIMAFYGIAAYHTPLNSMVRFYEFLQLLENISSKDGVSFVEGEKSEILHGIAIIADPVCEESDDVVAAINDRELVQVVFLLNFRQAASTTISAIVEIICGVQVLGEFSCDLLCI